MTTIIETNNSQKSRHRARNMVLVKEGDKKLQEFLDKVDIPLVKRSSLLLFALYVVYRLRSYTNWRNAIIKTFPMLPSSWWLGNASDMYEAGGFTEEFFFRLHKAMGPFTGFFIGPTIMNLSVIEPNEVTEMHLKCRSRPLETYLFLWYLGKENLMFQHGEMVKQMRLRYGKMISDKAALEKVNIKAYAEVSRLIDRIPTGQPFNLFKELGPLIYDIMGETMFDTPWLSTERGREIYRLHKYLIENVNRWMFWPIPPLFHPDYLRYLYTMYMWRKTIGDLMEERREQLARDPEKYATGAITLILTSLDEKTGKPFFSKSRGISTLCGFLNGAYDTTHSTTFWLFYHLGKYPEMQDKIYQELAQNVGPSDKVPAIDDIRKCEYLHAFLMESMRMRVTVPVNQRVNMDEDVQIGEYIVPKGVNVNFAISVQMSMEEYYGPKPKEFRPERFLGDSPEAERARRSWSAFGQGTRMCLGFTFALVELKCLVYTILMKRIVRLENPSEPGNFMLEAGVNQPAKKFNYIFDKRVDNQKIMEESNLRWWLQQDAEFQKSSMALTKSSVAAA